jgi:hypothetical protein
MEGKRDEEALLALCSLGDRQHIVTTIVIEVGHDPLGEAI